MNELNNFEENVGMKFQLYNGLFLNLPFDEVRTTVSLLPLFISYCTEQLAIGKDPVTIVDSFFKAHSSIADQKDSIKQLFSMMRLVERQVVLFDALEDSAFLQTHDLHGPGSLKDLLNRIENSGLQDQYQAFLDDYSVRIVLTAHPTQFYTDDVLTILTDLSSSLKKNDLYSIHELLLQMGQTRFRNRQKPTPLEEAQGLMWILEHIMYPVIPQINQTLITESGIPKEKALAKAGILDLGFWPGGDRDGNPFVNSRLTLQVSNLLRTSILNRYLEDIRLLRRRLTFGDIPSTIDTIESQLLAAISPDQAGVAKRGYKNPSELLTDLLEIHREVSTYHNGLFNDRLEQLIYRIQSFGFHFASLDVRQDSRIHTRVFEHCAGVLDLQPDHGIDGLTTLVQKLVDMSDEKKSQILVQIKKILENTKDDVLIDCIESFDAIQEIQSTNGEIGAHRYIISNTQSPVDIIRVWILALLSKRGPQNLKVDIVPLFETIPDLHNAPGIMETLYQNPLYENHLKNRKSQQTIMLGFSDGTKDGGYVTANWEIYRTKELLTKIARQRGWKVAFFDGRGGPPARGGGNTHKFYRSLSSEIDSRTLQLTIQGQTITSLYGTPESAHHNLEQLVSAGIENNLFPADHHTLKPEERKLLDEMSGIALDGYTTFKGHPQFLEYLQEMTPLQYYGKTNTGSRPTKRAGSSKLSLDALRAIPFVGAWSQAKLNVPGYYGFGLALEQLIAEGRLSEIKDLYRNNLFFRTLVENSMQSLSKSYFDLTKYQEQDRVYGEFWQTIYQEGQRSIRNILEISGQTTLLESEPLIRQSIQLRENMILPSLVIQQYALCKLRNKEGLESEHQQGSIEKLVLKSLAATINASRNAV